MPIYTNFQSYTSSMDGKDETFLGRELVPHVSGADGFSAFQKAVRRSDWPLAREVVSIFHTSGYANALWNRIFLICAEDVGIADAWLVERIFQQYDAWRQVFNRLPKSDKVECPKTKKTCALHLMCAARLLVDAPKCRLNDNVIYHPDVLKITSTYDWNKPLNEREFPIPKRYGRMYEHACIDRNRQLELAVIQCVASTNVSESRRRLVGMALIELILHQNNDVDKLGSLFRVKLAKPAMNGLIERLGKSMRAPCVRFTSLCGRVLDRHLPQQKLWLVHFMMWACSNEPDELVAPSYNPFTLASKAYHEPTLCNEKNAAEAFSDDEWTKLSKYAYYEENALPFPDYVYDKHTLEGARLGRGFQHFFDEGALLIQPTNLSIEPPIDPFRDGALEALLQREHKCNESKKRIHDNDEDRPIKLIRTTN